MGGAPLYKLQGTQWSPLSGYDNTASSDGRNPIITALVAGGGGTLYAARFGNLCSNTGTPAADVHIIDFGNTANGDFVLAYTPTGYTSGIALGSTPSGSVWSSLSEHFVVNLTGCVTKEDFAAAVVAQVSSTFYFITDNGNGTVTCTQRVVGELYNSAGTGSFPAGFLTYTGAGVLGGTIMVNHTVTGATVWEPLARTAGGSQKINALAVVGTDVYCGGSFTVLEGVNATNLAKWDGSSVSAVSNGVSRPVYALANALANAFSSNVRVLLQNDHTYDYQLQIPADPETGTASYSIVIPAKGEVIIDLADWLRVEWEDSKTIAQKNNLSIKKVLRHPSILG